MAENKKTDSKVETIVTNKKLSKEDLEFQKLMQFAQLARHIKKDLNSNTKVQSTFHKNFTKDNVMTWMANPSKYEKKLRDLSRFLYDSSNHYKRLVQYFATMLSFDYIIEPYGISDIELTEKNIENIQKKYINVVNQLNVMNVKHEFLKIMEKAWVDDVVYLYEYSLKDSYFLDTLNPDYCQISGIEDGCLTFSFNFQYFDTYKDELDRFSDEFNKKYNIYKGDKKNSKWQEIDPSKSMCIKINENTDYTIPPFCGVFEEIYSLEDYKMLKLSKTELENYLLLVASIPYRKDGNGENEFALSLDKAIEYFNLMNESLPDQVGGILSPFSKIEPVKVDKTDKSSDTVAEAEKSLYDSAGVSQLLFNSGVTSGAALSKSILVDETISFKVLRQFERWVNKKLKDTNKVISFQVKFLDITKYSQNEYIKNLKDASTLGLPVKMMYSASLGLTPSSTLNMTILENDVLKITKNWIPLKSSHTQSGDSDGDGGKPQSSEDELDDTGQQARDNDVNNPDNRG